MRIDRHPELIVREEDTKRLCEEFHDNKILFVINRTKGRLEAWYKPDSGAAYFVSSAIGVGHAIRLLRNLLRFERTRAKDVLREIDDFNEKLLADKDADAMHEVEHDLRRILSGKQLFAPRGRVKCANLRHA